MKINVQDVSINPGELEKIISSLETAISRNTRVKELCEEILEVQKSSTSGLRKNGGKGKGGRRNKRPQGRKTLAETIAEVLSSNRGPLRPIELKNKVVDVRIRNPEMIKKMNADWEKQWARRRTREHDLGEVGVRVVGARGTGRRRGGRRKELHQRAAAEEQQAGRERGGGCLLYTSPSPRDRG